MSTKPANAIWCPSCGGDKGHSVPDRLASIASYDGYAERWEDCQTCDAEGWIIPECAYCGTTHALRVESDGCVGWALPEYICEECFSGGDTGPCFDDLPAVRP